MKFRFLYIILRIGNMAGSDIFQVPQQSSMVSQDDQMLLPFLRIVREDHQDPTNHKVTVGYG